MTVRKYIAILLGKIIFRVLRFFRSGGTSLPGEIALFVCPDIFSFMARDVKTVLVSGTNGKTTTVNMIAHMLKQDGTPYIATISGGNENSSICTEYILNYDLKHCKSKVNLAVIECDEKYVPMVFSDVTPSVIVVTNILKDQIDRLGTPDDVFRTFCNAMQNSDAVFCLNNDDPYCKRFITVLSGKNIVKYGKCGTIWKINEQNINLNINLKGDFNYKNALAACAAMYAQNKLTDGAIASLETMPFPFGRMESVDLSGVPITLNLAKNTSGVEETLRYILSLKRDYKIVFRFNRKVSDGHDISWIEEVDLKHYSNILSDVLICGKCSEFTQRVLHKNGIFAVGTKNYNDLLKRTLSSNKPVFFIMNYTFMMEFRKLLAKNGYVKNFWEL